MNLNKQKIKDIFLNNGFLKVVSLLIACGSWIAVGMGTSGTDIKILEVPVTINLKEETLTQQGLELIESSPATAKVTIEGKPYIVGNVTVRDLGLEAQLLNVSGPGDYELTLEPINRYNKEFTVKEISPATVTAKFDQLLERKFAIEPEISNATLPEGYVFRQDQVQVSPAEITVKGPAAQLDKIARVVVRKDFEQETLSKTTTHHLEVYLLDQNGNELETGELELSQSTVDVTIPVYKNKIMPLAVDFVNLPTSFPKEELLERCTLSNEEINISGPSEKIDNLTGELVVGYVDLSTLSPENSFRTFDVVLPMGISNVDNIESISLEFDMTDMVEKVFYVPVSNIRILNAPVGYNVTLLSQQLANVHIVGTKDIMDSLTGKDIIAEVDLSDRQITTGQISMPVSVSVPGKGLVWAVGSDYKALVSIQEK